MLVEMSERAIPRTLSCCPLCDWKEDARTGQKLIEHIATDIYDFALRALPWIDFDESASKDAASAGGSAKDHSEDGSWDSKVSYGPLGL